MSHKNFFKAKPNINRQTTKTVAQWMIEVGWGESRDVGWLWGGLRI